jgi:PIN domain nuclease of toxin-antitoxin system
MSAPLLLDTCAALWIMEDAEIRPEAVDAIDRAADQREPVYVSPIIGWEIGLLAWKGRFKSSFSPQRWLEQLLARRQIALADMPPHVLLQSSLLPGTPPADPADRIIAATAREYGYRVVTRDRALLAYAAQGHLAAIAC